MVRTLRVRVAGLAFGLRPLRGATRVLVGLLMLGPGCRDPARPPPPPPDLVPPEIAVVFPTPGSGTYDRDSNGLVDLELAWSDSGRGVDLGTLEVRDIYPVPGGPRGPNLLSSWRVGRLDTAGLVLEETVAGLVPAGYHRFELSLADSAGNLVVESTQVLILPPGAYHATIDLAYRPEWQQVRAANLVLTPDGRKGIVPFTDGRVAIFDPDGLQPTRWFEGAVNTIFASDISLDWATGLAYIGGGGGETPGITVFDTRTELPVRNQFVGLGVASVAVHGDRVYVGEACTSGRIIVLDKTTLAELGRIDPGLPYPVAPCNNPRAEVVTPDGRVGWAWVVYRGILSFDPQAFTVIRRYDVAPPVGDGYYYGNVRDIKMLGGRWLYLAKLEGGLDEFDTQTDSVTSHYPAGRPVTIKELAVSPDGRLLFVSADTSTAGPYDVRAPLLFDVPGLRFRYRFPPRGGAIGDAAVWHPDGRRVYLMASFDVDVYLVRP